MAFQSYTLHIYARMRRLLVAFGPDRFLSKKLFNLNKGVGHQTTNSKCKYIQ